MVGCGGGSGSVSTAPDTTLLATTRLGPGGGTLTITAGAHAGVALTVRPGALAASADFSIHCDTELGLVPSLFPVYRFEPADLVVDPDSIAVTVRAAGQFFASTDQGQVPLSMFSQPGALGSFEVAVVSQVDEVDRTVTSSPTRLGRFFAWNGDLHRVFAQGFKLLDPAAPTRFTHLFGVEVTIDNGSDASSLGRGSLASFWQSPASANVLILHGLSGSPLDFRGPQDLVATLPASIANIVLAVFPSGLGVAANANALYDEIRAHQLPGFGCTIIGHSLGGQIGRYLLERSHADPERGGFAATDLPASDVIAKLIMLGTPNAGSSIAGGLFAALVPNLPAADAKFVRAGLDLSEADDSFMAGLNAAYVDNPTVYHTICGDLGNGTDGIVSVASARAIPLFPPETETVFPVGHFDLHGAAGWNGVSALLGTLLQAP